MASVVLGAGVIFGQDPIRFDTMNDGHQYVQDDRELGVDKKDCRKEADILPEP